MDVATMERRGGRAALAHLAASALLLAAAAATAPAKFERAGGLIVALAVALLAAGAATARAAWTARARHGIDVPGWSPFDRGWWTFDPPLRAFHWSFSAFAMLLAWLFLLGALAFESVVGVKLPAALDALASGAGQPLTGLGGALCATVGGYLLARRWARREPA